MVTWGAPILFANPVSKTSLKSTFYLATTTSGTGDGDDDDDGEDDDHDDDGDDDDGDDHDDDNDGSEFLSLQVVLCYSDNEPIQFIYDPTPGVCVPS